TCFGRSRRGCPIAAPRDRDPQRRSRTRRSARRPAGNRSGCVDGHGRRSVVRYGRRRRPRRSTPVCRYRRSRRSPSADDRPAGYRENHAGPTVARTLARPGNRSVTGRQRRTLGGRCSTAECAAIDAPAVRRSTSHRQRGRPRRPWALSLRSHVALVEAAAPDFSSNGLDALRQPLESGRVVLSRASQTIAFPASFQLILAANPCPCGQAGAINEHCQCSPLMRRRYVDRISGPIRDRIDLHRTLLPQSRAALADGVHAAHSSERLAQSVANARQRQAYRYADTPWTLNSHVPGSSLRNKWPVTPEARELIERQLAMHHLNDRSADRVARIAWTIADLRDHDQPARSDVEAAIGVRRSQPLSGDLLDLVRAL